MLVLAIPVLVLVLVLVLLLVLLPVLLASRAAPRTLLLLVRSLCSFFSSCSCLTCAAGELSSKRRFAG